MQANSSEGILISICMPTYNNAQRFAQVLRSFAIQNLEGVELLIRDDSTSHDTKNIVEKYPNLPIRYFSGEKEGFDEAVLFLTKQAKGEYVWWFGDDLLESGAVENLKNVLKKYPELVFVWLNSGEAENPDYTAIKIKDDRFFKDRNEIIEIDIGLLAFMTSTVVKRSCIIPFLTGAPKYKKSQLISFSLVMGLLSSTEGSYYFVSHPYILGNAKPAGEVRWYDQFQVWCVNIFNVAQDFKNKFSARSLKIAFSKQLRQVIKAIIVERSLGLKTGFATDSPKIIPMLRLYWAYWEAWFAVPLLLSPRSILKFFYWGYKKFR